MRTVLVLCDHFLPSTRAGGPVRSLARIVLAERAGARICVVTRDRDLGSSRVIPQHELDSSDAAFTGVTFHRLGRYREVLAMSSLLRKKARSIDLLYLNSVMSPIYTVLPIGLMRLGIIERRPVLVAPRGELSPAALRIKRHKKRAASRVLRGWFHRLDVVWHVSSELEAQQVRSFMDATPTIVVRPNPAPPPEPTPSLGAPTRPTHVAFVGRVVSIKNLTTLLNAAREVSFPLRITVAGALQEPSYWRQCQRLIKTLDDCVQIDVRGHITGLEVAELLSSADALVLPTSGENFGQAIAEALAVGCPVMIPDTTPWTPVVRSGGGWIIDSDDPRPLHRALNFLQELEEDERFLNRTRALRAYATWWNLHQSERGSLFSEAQFATARARRSG